MSTKFRFLLLIVALLLPACSSTSYTRPDGTEFSSTTFFMDRQIQDFKVSAGNETVELGSVKTSATPATDAIDAVTGIAQ